MHSNSDPGNELGATPSIPLSGHGGVTQSGASLSFDGNLINGGATTLWRNLQDEGTDNQIKTQCQPHVTHSSNPQNNARHSQSSSAKAQPAPPDKICRCGGAVSHSLNGEPTRTAQQASSLSSTTQAFSEPVSRMEQGDGNLITHNPLPASAQQRSISYGPQPTTVYTFPPRYSTFQHPLTPEELAFLQRNPELFSRGVPQAGSNGIASRPVPATAQGTTHSCNCGDACNCLGCAAHPYNSRTLTFVQSIQDIFTAESRFGGSDGGPLSPQGIRMNMLGAMPVTNNIQYSNSSASIFNYPQESRWLQTRPGLSQPFGGQNLSTPVGGVSGGAAPNRRESDSGIPTDTLPDGAEAQDQSSVSPSAFFHVDYPMPSCADEPSACLCGDGCTCIGCLIHQRSVEPSRKQSTSQLEPMHSPVDSAPAWPDTFTPPSLSNELGLDMQRYLEGQPMLYNH